MLLLDRESGAWRDSWFNQLPELLHEGDVLVLNDSRVIPARMFGVRPGSTGKVEVLLAEQLSDWEWRALTRPARRMAVGQELAFATAGNATAGYGRSGRRVRGAPSSLQSSR